MKTLFEDESSVSSCIAGFNDLYRLSSTSLDLDDERTLLIDEWEPFADCDSISHVKVRVKGTVDDGYVIPQFDNGFNRRARCPEKPIDLGDGRVLKFKEWRPKYVVNQLVTVEIIGLIMREGK